MTGRWRVGQREGAAAGEESAFTGVADGLRTVVDGHRSAFAGHIDVGGALAATAGMLDEADGRREVTNAKEPEYCAARIEDNARSTEDSA